ncbi:putative Unc104-like kinesin [Leptomonas pyrrhocoris]|uniref:Putative Unc104-like kinesin n=1 Tax=Leptomonas pyrrhocoris TaxID=157538 RepID=A0A0N0DVZ6_LEPPY|nr:putative Unc104-like kinesin [Leptomonas pyrrhocoris]KPA81042.1 putative Unc104-like kinesin [Leptomonas pyrrhocoris]|eukprot:XP_015659481.1 putative Unc104-like kinesin [Leptomonas pyrrhocoris]
MNASPRERPTNGGRGSSVADHVDDDAGKHSKNYEDGRITVSVRVRPLNSRESKFATGSCVVALSAYNTLYIFPTSETERDLNALVARDPQLRGVSHHRFTFDHVYATDATQEQVYEQVGHPVLQSSFRGYHTCIFAYGQTGSGKSYCMMGADGGRALDDAPGIIPRLCRELFAEVATRQAAAADSNEQVEFSVYVSYLEIYHEHVRSLLDESADAKVVAPKEPSTPRSTANALRRTAASFPSSSFDNTTYGNLRVREHPTLGVYVEGLAEIPVTSVDQVLLLMVRGNHRRHTASTRMNDTSSRSHAIFTIQLIQKKLHTVLPAGAEGGALRREGDDDSPANSEDAPSSVTATAAAYVAAAAAASAAVTATTQLGAKINLVDLAGSERAKATGAEGDTLKEGAQINKSLTTLGIVINALAARSTSNAVASPQTKSNSATAAGKRHVPYRDSILTFLLKESLGGNSKTFMIATVSPSTDSYDESVSTLRYADRAKAIVMRAFVNETAGDKRIRELEEEVTRLRERIKALLDAEAMRSSSIPAEASPSLALSPSLPASHTPMWVAEGASLSSAHPVGSDAHSDASNGDSGATDLNGVAGHTAEDTKEEEHSGEDREGGERKAFYDASPTASLPAASPTEPREAVVDILQGELRRAEEMIRQMSLTQAERDAHIAKLVEEQEKERAAMRAAAAAAAAARQEAEKAAAALSPVQTSTMRLHRDEPYLLNMDGAGDWVVAHLGPAQTFVGVFHPRKGKKTAYNEDDADDATPRSLAASYDSSLSLPSSDGAAPPSAAGSDEQKEAAETDSHSSGSPTSAVRYVKLPRKFGDGVGSPHCILERAAATGTTGTVTLRGCAGFEVVVFRPLCAAPFVVSGAGNALELQSGDVLDIGNEHIQLKYIDPSVPPVTARGRRTVALPVGRAFPHTTSEADDTAESERGVRSLSTSPASQGRSRHEMQARKMPALPLKNLHPPSGGKDTDSEGGEEEREATTFTHSPAESDEEREDSDDYNTEEEEEGTESETDSEISPMNSPADEPRRSLEVPARPFIPALALGKALPSVFPSAPQPPQQHVDPDAGNSLHYTDSTTATITTTITTTADGGDGRASSSSVTSSAEGAAGDANLHAATSGHTNKVPTFSESSTTVSTSASSLKFKSRKPSKRAEDAAAAAAVGLMSRATPLLSEMHSMRTNGMPSTYRSELPAHFVGRYNLVLVGPSGGGKTSIVNNLALPDTPWLRSAFSAFTSGGSRDASATAVHPTIGIQSKPLTCDGPVPMLLHTHELGGTPCFSPLLDQLPSHRVTYLLCFPLHSLTSLMALRGVVEDILCRTDSHTVSLVLVGTHADRNAAGKEDGSYLSRLSAARQEMLQRQLEEVEQQVVSLIQMLQLHPQLRPTVVGRFAVDNVHRNIYAAGYQPVEGFPQWLQWLADVARDRCRSDVDFANGLVPARCLELGRQVSLLRLHGKWCVSLRDFKTLAAAVSSQYKADAGEPTRRASQLTPAARDALRNHVQLLADWGVLLHRYRSLPLRQHIILDVKWLSRLLAALACCPLIAAAESDGLSKEEAATMVDIVGEGGVLSLSRKEAALRTLLTPEAERVVDMVKVATTDTPHLLRLGVLSIPVLIAMLEPHFKRGDGAEAAGRDVAVGYVMDNTSARQQHSTPFNGLREGDGGRIRNDLPRYAVPLAGVVELLVLLDLIIVGSKLSFSPSPPAQQSAKPPQGTSPFSSAVGALRDASGATTPAESIGAKRTPDTEEEEAADDVAKESFVLYPLSFRTPASAGVTWLFPCFLSGPFYVFKLDMVPRNFFPKLLCRLATVADKIYLGSVEGKLWGTATQRWANDPTQPRSTVGRRSGLSGGSGVASPATAIPTASVAGPFDSYFQHRAGSPFVLPSFSPYLVNTTSDGRLRRRDGFWFDAAWLVYNGDTGATASADEEGKRADRCRVLVRLVHHSVFLSFHCHSVAAPASALSFSAAVCGGDTASAGVQDFYEAVLEAVRYVVEEFPGGKCVESMQCCVDSATLLQSAQQHPAMQSDQDAAAQERHMRFANISENINNLERVLSKSGAALRTARTARRPNVLMPGELSRAGAEDEDESTYVPLLRHFSETPPLSIHECIRRWKSEQRLYIAPDVEAHLTAALHDLEECYHGDVSAVSSDSCAKLDYLLDVLARVDTI